MGDVVAIFGGQVISVTDYLNSPDPGLFKYSGVRGALQLEDDLILVPRKAGPAEWIQHSCEPNCGFSGETTVIAMRHISAGEAISFDFATADALPHHDMSCRCATASCRHRITGSDWTKPELQRQLDGYFSGYLQRRVDSCEENSILEQWLSKHAGEARVLH